MINNDAQSSHLRNNTVLHLSEINTGGER